MDYLDATKGWVNALDLSDIWDKNADRYPDKGTRAGVLVCFLQSVAAKNDFSFILVDPRFKGCFPKL